ncbi:MAG: hypothetical protein Q8K63_05310 [Acidimicrobiales bacterium]|nr:hypothetical protein [Acidimicrobiales bacterium]
MLHRWLALPAAPIAGRIGAGSVWTGDELVIFGGVTRAGRADADAIVEASDGAAYRPATRTWRLLSPPPQGVLGVVGSASAWTGDIAVFWAGNSPDGPAVGALYDPGTDSWQRLPAGPLGPREGYASVWTGQELLVIGGTSGDGIAEPTAAAIDPEKRTWRQLRGLDAFPGLLPRGAVWTGSEVIIPGSLSLCPDQGSSCTQFRPIVVAYEPTRDTVREISLAKTPMTTEQAEGLAAVGWTGTRVLMSVAETKAPRLFTYEPATDKWVAAASAPCEQLDASYSATAWTGQLYIAACGRDSIQIYDAAGDEWKKLATGESPLTTRSGPVVAWTGDTLIAWSGTPRAKFNPTPADGAELRLP